MYVCMCALCTVYGVRTTYVYLYTAFYVYIVSPPFDGLKGEDGIEHYATLSIPALHYYSQPHYSEMF